MPDHKVHCEECGGFLNIRGVGSCHCSTEHKPNDEPKIAPSAMKAAHTELPWKADKNEGCKTIRGAKRGSHKQAHYGTGICTTHGINEKEDRANADFIVRACNSYYDDATHLSAIEEALRGLVEKCHHIMKVRNVKSALAESPKTAQRFLAALTQAKEALKL